MNCAEIHYGSGIAKIWGSFATENVEQFFMRHANQCFGIRKSITGFKLLAIAPCENLPDPWSKFVGAATVLTHSGDVIVWSEDGKKIKTEWD